MGRRGACAERSGLSAGRRHADRGVFAAKLVIGAALGLCACGADGAKSRPESLVLVVVDALRADRLGLHGNPQPTSPFLDALAERSVVFESSTSTSSHTVPSTLSLLTGLYPAHHGNRFFPETHSFRAPRRRVRPELPAQLTTLAQYFAQHGHRTGAVVANPWLDSRYGFDRGFERYEHVVADPEQKDASRAPTLNRAARALLADWDDDPFFLYLHYMDVHSPYEPPEPHRSRFAPSTGSLVYRNGPTESVSAEDLAFSQALYDAELRAFDDGVREFFAILRELDRDASTWVVFTSDHGDEFYEHGGLGHGFTLYEEVLRTPLVVFHPALGDRARRIATPVSAVDVVPTALALVGAPLPDALDGVSLAASIRGEEAPPEDRTLLAELGHAKAARRGSWKRIREAGSEERDRVFDLASDPGEQRPLTAHQAPSAALLEHLLIPIEDPSAKPTTPSPAEERLRTRLEALGYVE